MGIFQSRPEEPDEWAGLPSEPWQPRVPGELLPPALDDPGAIGDLGILAASGESASFGTIEIAVEIPADLPSDGGDAG